MKKNTKGLLEKKTEEQSALTLVDFGRLLALSLAGLLDAGCMFLAISAVAVADATALNASLTLWAALLGAVVLQERLTKRVFLAAALCVVGTALIVRPPFLFKAQRGQPMLTVSRLIGFTAALGSGFFAAGAVVSLRRMRALTTDMLLLWMSGPAALIFLVYILLIGDERFGEFFQEFGWCVGGFRVALVGLGTLVGIVAATVALQNLRASVMATVSASSIIVFGYAYVRVCSIFIHCNGNL